MSASLQCWVSVTNNRASRPSQFSDKLIFSWPCLLPAACCPANFSGLQSKEWVIVVGLWAN